MNERLLCVFAIALPLACGCAQDTRVSNLRDHVVLASKLNPVGQPPGSPKAIDLKPVPVPTNVVPRINIKPDDAAPWALPLEESLAIALSHSDIVRVADGSGISANATTGYDPAMAAARARAALATFDPLLNVSGFGNWFNQPPEELFGPGIPEQTRRREAGANASLIKPWVTGGTTQVGYNPPTGFLFLPNGGPAIFNPLINSNIEFLARQPLLRGAGLEVNRAPIVVARIQGEQSLWDLKQALMASVRSVQEAYWNLQAAQVTLQAYDEALSLVEEVVRVQEENLAADRIIRSDLAKARGQLHLFRQQRLQARSTVLDSELRLRNLLGLEPSDDRRIVASSSPARARLVLDSVATMNTAIFNRPDVIRQRLNVRVRELQLLVTRNAFLPQLDAQALYRMNGLGQDLGAALNQMTSDRFADWQTALTFSVPLGRRMATANVRGAETLLAKDNALLRQTVHAAAYQLGDIVRQLHYTYGQYQEAQRRLEEANAWLAGARLRYQNPPPAAEGQDWLLAVLNDYYLAVRFKIDAVTTAATLLAQYNGQLVRLQEAKGTLLAQYDIHVLNDPCTQARFADAAPLKFEDIDLDDGQDVKTVPADPAPRSDMPSGVEDLPSPHLEPLPPVPPKVGDELTPPLHPPRPEPPTAGADRAAWWMEFLDKDGGD